MDNRSLTLLSSLATTDVGLLGYLFHRYDGQGWFPARDGSDASRVRSIMILVLCTASLNILFTFATSILLIKGAFSHNDWFTSGLVWLWIIPIVLWGVSTGMFHGIAGRGCQGQPLISLCYQLVAVEVLGWTAFALLTLSISTGCLLYKARQRVQRKPRRTSRV